MLLVPAAAPAADEHSWTLRSGAAAAVSGLLLADTRAVTGDANVDAQKTLAVSIADGGDITYSGNAIVTSSVAGSGKIRRR